MPTKRKKADYAPHIAPEQAPRCHMSGCAEPGVYKAPRSKGELHDYQWYCLEHIREHNKQWDFFAGMNSEQIEHFIQDAVTGHRPTWERESHIKQQHYEQVQDALHAFFHGVPKKPGKKTPPLSAKLKRALKLFGLDYPYSARELKTRYRILVKQYHPDRHKGDKAAEEQFKLIAIAYHDLTMHTTQLAARKPAAPT